MKEISIIYAYRNREIQRIKASLDSLTDQKTMNFEVIFVNYGSDKRISIDLEMLVRNYNFLKYYYLDVEQQLWNKSKALNFGIKKATNPFVFIADVDIIFDPTSLEILSDLASENTYCLFSLGYLSKKESLKLKSGVKYKHLNPYRFGDVNGLVLSSRDSFFAVHGYDEFFHFYGSEDVDLYGRLSEAGYRREKINEVHFYHIWHSAFYRSESRKLSATPALDNALRLNEQHFLFHRRERCIIPHGQNSWGENFSKAEIMKLHKPTRRYNLLNIQAHVDHFFYVELPKIENEVVEVDIQVDPFYYSTKYRIKKALRKRTQTYCTLKEVNNILLKQIVFLYRNYNYSYEVSNDMSCIKFKIAFGKND